LTNDGQEVFGDENLGGSSLLSKALGMNILNELGYSLH